MTYVYKTEGGCPFLPPLAVLAAHEPGSQMRLPQGRSRAGALPLGAPEPDPVSWAIALGCSPTQVQARAVVGTCGTLPRPWQQWQHQQQQVPGGLSSMFFWESFQDPSPKPGLSAPATMCHPQISCRDCPPDSTCGAASVLSPGGCFLLSPSGCGFGAHRWKLPSGDPALPAWPTRCPPYRLANVGFRGAPREPGVAAAELSGPRVLVRGRRCQLRLCVPSRILGRHCFSVNQPELTTEPNCEDLCP